MVIPPDAVLALPPPCCGSSTPAVLALPHRGTALPPGVQVPRLQASVRDRRANWEQSLRVLRMAKEAGARVTKTSIMLGCGEGPDEVVEALRTLR